MSDEPFPEALSALLLALQTEPLRPVTMRQFFARVEGWGYDALRKMTRGDATLQPAAMEAMAKAAGIIGPEYFREYRAHQLGKAFLDHAELGYLYEEVMTQVADLEDEASRNEAAQSRDSRPDRGGPRSARRKTSGKPKQ